MTDLDFILPSTEAESAPATSTDDEVATSASTLAKKKYFVFDRNVNRRQKELLLLLYVYFNTGLRFNNNYTVIECMK